MRILLLTSSLERGGAESHIFSLATEISRQGHIVTVASSGGRIAEALERTGIDHVRIRLDRKDPLSIMRARRALGKLVKREGYDVIHAHSRIAAFAVSGVAKKYGIPFVTTVHARFCALGVYRKLSRWGEVSVAVSEDLRQYLCENYNVSPENTRVIANGVDTDRFNPSDRPSKNVKNIVFASRLDRDCSKTAFLLLSLSERLREAFPEIEFHICGGGECLDALRKKARDKEYFHILGNIDRMENILSDAHVFVGVSRAAIEAMACGIPTVLSGDEGFFGLLKYEEDIRKNALCNFCCRGMESPDEESLYRSLCRVLSLDENERKGIGIMLSRYIRENCRAEEMAKKTLEVYKEVKRIGEKDRKGILLCGYYGFGNMGDNALLRASVKLAKRRYPGRQICAFTKRPKRDSADFNIRCVNRMSPFSVMKEISRSYALVFGGGTLLQENTSLRSLLYYTTVIKYAAKKGVRVELWGNGLGTPDSRMGRALMRSALLRCEYVGLRDMLSLSECFKMTEDALENRIFYESDLARRQSAAVPSRVEYLLDGLGVTDKTAPNGYAVVAVRGSEGRGYIKILYEWLCSLCSEGIRLLFVPMFPKEDREESLRLCKRLDGIMVENICESDMVGLIERGQVVCGMRFHSLVFAAAADTPFVGFGSDPKVERFCRENGGLYFTDLY